MRPSRAALLAFGVVCVAYAVCGCGGRLLPLDASGELEDSGIAATDGATPGSGTGAGSEGGASCASPATGLCNAVALQGLPITPATSDAAPPPMTGGAIADGTYVLTAITTYGDTMDDTAVRATLVVSGGCIQSNDSIDGPANAVYSSSAAQLTLQQVCSGRLELWDSYAASPTTLLLEPVAGAGATTLYTYTRQ